VLSSFGVAIENADRIEGEVLGMLSMATALGSSARFRRLRRCVDVTSYDDMVVVRKVKLGKSPTSMTCLPPRGLAVRRAAKMG